MAVAVFRSLRKASSLVKPPSPSNPFVLRNLSHGTVNLVLSEGKVKFETHKVDPPKKEKWQTKKRLKMQRMREKQKRKEANKRDPRRLTVKRKKKQKFANAEERIKYKLERVSVLLTVFQSWPYVDILHWLNNLRAGAKIKEALLIERLKRYEVPKIQGPEALEKSKCEQSLESVRHFIAIAEKELELYYRHIALYGDPNNRNPLSILDSPARESQKPKKESDGLSSDGFSPGVSDTQVDSIDKEHSEIEDDYLSTNESDSLGSTSDWND
ncbi:hypothetical protein GH714_006740 [Hevea brasiliensis]|uniref:Uncharacterized protein n=1 Tax=Hevea brasiliensis TaxID=3981 RepID=A0A6A6NBV9_HEVBR|nr:hypothetical protein GH714_006740 [Hevea brasiliensis]